MSSYTDSTEVVITEVHITDEEIVFSYQLSTDIRDDGRVVQQHLMAVAIDHHTYGDNIITVIDTLKDLVKDILEDWPHKEPVRPDNKDDDEDDDRGMGF